MKALLTAILTGLATITAAFGDDPAPLANPFERPAWLSDAREVVEPVRQAKVRLDLRATLIGEPSLANVGGRIVMPGEEVDGYKLLSVSEGAAEFSDGERTIQVSVQPQPGEETDD